MPIAQYVCVCVRMLVLQRYYLVNGIPFDATMKHTLHIYISIIQMDVIMMR